MLKSSQKKREQKMEKKLANKIKALNAGDQLIIDGSDSVRITVLKKIGKKLFLSEYHGVRDAMRGAFCQIQNNPYTIESESDVLIDVKGNPLLGEVTDVYKNSGKWISILYRILNPFVNANSNTISKEPENIDLDPETWKQQMLNLEAGDCLVIGFHYQTVLKIKDERIFLTGLHDSSWFLITVLPMAFKQNKETGVLESEHDYIYLDHDLISHVAKGKRKIPAMIYRMWVR